MLAYPPSRAVPLPDTSSGQTSVSPPHGPELASRTRPRPRTRPSPSHTVCPVSRALINSHQCEYCVPACLHVLPSDLLPACLPACLPVCTFVLKKPLHNLFFLLPARHLDACLLSRWCCAALRTSISAEKPCQSGTCVSLMSPREHHRISPNGPFQFHLCQPLSDVTVSRHKLIHCSTGRHGRWSNVWGALWEAWSKVKTVPPLCCFRYCCCTAVVPTQRLYYQSVSRSSEVTRS